MRINLARTLYQKKDIYIFDDPFSALDIHVASRIIENGIINFLKDKTRIVVTHSIQYLKYADKIIHMSDGQVKTYKSYNQFKKSPVFKELKKTLKEENAEMTA